MKKECPICHDKFQVTPAQAEKRTYCSVACMKEGYAIRFKGSGNPNYRHERKTCSSCGKLLHRYAKGKYCFSCLYKSKEYENQFRRKKHSTTARLKMSEHHANIDGDKNPFFGKRHGRSAIEKMSKAHGEWWKVSPKEKRNKVISHLIRASHAQRVLRWTSPEKKVATALTSLGLEWEHNALLYNKFFVDFLLKDGTVIEVFGDYWHANPEVFSKPNPTQQKQQAKDKSRVAYLEKCGHRVIIVWEKCIHSENFNISVIMKTKGSGNVPVPAGRSSNLSVVG